MKVVVVLNLVLSRCPLFRVVLVEKGIWNINWFGGQCGNFRVLGSGGFHK